MKLRSYLSKLFLVSLLLISVSSCKKETDEEINNDVQYEYVTPANDTGLFNYLRKDVKDLLFKANTGETLDDNQLKLFNARLYQGSAFDINGNLINFADFNNKDIVFEVVSIYCSHCKVQISKYNESIIEQNPNIQFIQFFAEGDGEAIRNFYKDCNTEIDENVIIIPADKDVLDYILKIGVNLTPSILCFRDGYLTFPRVGFTTSTAFNCFYDIAFANAFDASNLVDENNNSIFKNRRTNEDVKNDLKQEDILKLQELDNDGNTENITYSLIGQTLDYTDLFDSEDPTLPTVDFTKYQNENVAIFYLYMTDLKDTDVGVLKMVNKIISSHPEISFINVIVDEDLSSYSKYISYGIELKGETVSGKSSLPKDFSKIYAYNYPTVTFVEKGTFTGAYSSCSDIKGFDSALELFIGENSIAHIN